MLTIPTGDTARAAWAALPLAVREDVKQRADRFEGHPDPAVAAVVVGRLRSGVDLQWYRVVGAFVGTIIGCAAVVVSLGDAGSGSLLGMLSLGAFGFILSGAAMHWTEQHAIRRAEVANLNVFLAAPGATASEPPPKWKVRPRSALALIAALGIPATAYGLIHRLDIAFSWSTLGRNAALGACALVLINLVRFMQRSLDPRKDRAYGVSAGEDGLRFGRRAPVPWSDVVGVELAGPSASDPDEKDAMVWTLRGRPAVRVPLLRVRQPERLILTARSHMEAAA